MVEKLYENLYSPLVESIGGIGDSGGAQPQPPQPIQYLTAWELVGNSEVKTLPYADIPQGYTRCKYLEAHGTEYIELPIGFDNTDEVELTVSFTEINLSDKYAIAPKIWSSNDNRFAMGMVKKSISGVQTYIFNVGYGSVGTNATIFEPLVVQDTNVHLFTYANYLFKLDNSSVRDVSEITFGGTTDKLRLFYGYSSPTKCRIYAYHQAKADNTEINLIPCLDDNDVPCMYDTISGETFYNDGTGTFGYEVEAQPTEIWSCGELGQDTKYHIYVSSNGNVFDIVLDEPLRKYSTAADSIEYENETATLTREVEEVDGELDVLDTPTTETITVPAIEVSSTDTYTQVISQGAHAVAWTSFTPNPE